ncbi:MAG: ABC transporter ATP-binding protein/permease [Actinomycetota bacterium]|nr:ABC transporter ATP-binding protein/permease [Actinomycetota bacterium]
MGIRPRKERLAGLSRLVGLELPREDERAAGGQLLRDCLRRERRWAGLFVLGTVARTLAALLLPVTVAGAIDAAATGADISTPLLRVGVVVAVLAVSDATAELANSYYAAGVIVGVRDRFVRHTLRLWVPGRQRFAAGELLSRLSVDTASPAGFMSLVVATLVMLLSLVGAVTMLGFIEWTLAVVVLLGVPVALLAIRLFVAEAGEPFLRYQQLQADVVTRLIDALQGARTIRASGTTGREITRILRPLPTLNAAGRQVWATQGRISWQLLLLVPLLQVVVLCVGGFGVAAGRITPGELVAAAAYVVLAVDSLEVVDMLVSALQSHVGATRVATVLASPPAVAPVAAGYDLPPGPGRLELRGVTVRMGDRVVLDHLDLAVPAGASVAVVGRSGTGKSVLASLVGRLLDPQDGDVRIDGVAVSGVQLAQLRRAVTYAFERPALLGDTIHDTIAYARPDASRAEVEEAARAAQADYFIRLLPEGYDTDLAGVRLSGGEVQRLGLARAMLTDARVVVLDDATSSLDTATEVKVAQALEENLAGRTSLVVAHRTGTAARADLVAWLDGGRIRALAPHAALWSDPDYRRTFAADPELVSGR